MVGGIGPGRCINLVGVDGEIVRTVHVPADLLRRDALVEFHAIGVISTHTAITGVRSTAEAGIFITRTAWRHAAVQRSVYVGLRVDIFQNIDLTDPRPVGVDAAERRAQRPEGRPVSLRSSAGNIWLLDRSFNRHRAARRRLEICPLGLDAPRCPVAGTIPQGGDCQVAAGLVDVGGAVGHVLDLTGSPTAAGAAAVASADIINPVAATDCARTVKFIRPLLCPATQRAGWLGAGILHFHTQYKYPNDECCNNGKL